MAKNRRPKTKKAPQKAKRKYKKRTAKTRALTHDKFYHVCKCLESRDFAGFGPGEVAKALTKALGFEVSPFTAKEAARVTGVKLKTRGNGNGNGRPAKNHPRLAVLCVDLKEIAELLTV